jgi:hypothetical protein
VKDIVFIFVTAAVLVGLVYLAFYLTGILAIVRLRYS